MAHLLRIAEAAADPADPIEKMFAVQLAWCHAQLGNLLLKAANAETIDGTVALNGAAARLSAEFRKSALAWRDYRTPVQGPRVMLVGQQNIAAVNQTEVSIDAASTSPATEKKSTDSELGTKRDRLSHVDHHLDAIVTSDHSEAEPSKAKRNNSGRAGTVTPNGNGHAALAAINGSANGCW